MTVEGEMSGRLLAGAVGIVTGDGGNTDDATGAETTSPDASITAPLGVVKEAALGAVVGATISAAVALEIASCATEMA